MSNLQVKVVPKGVVAEWVCDLITNQPRMATATLLSGDRWTCISHVAVAMLGDKPVGIATIAPEGEELSGEPSIVGLYVLHEHRRTGVGLALLNAAIDYMVERKLTPIRLDVLNTKVFGMIAHLPAEKQALLNVIDMSDGAGLDTILDR